MHLSEETIYTNKLLLILDADCKKEQTIVLLKGKGVNIVQLNGETIFTGPTGHHKIRFTKEHFCLLNDSTLSFYKLKGEYVSECDIGTNVFELFPYRQGVLCIYGDEGIFGEKMGNNRLNYAAPLAKPESYLETALENKILYDALFARYKPFACLGWESDELIFLNDKLKKEKAIKVPFATGNIIAFALTYEFGAFIEETRFWLWDFEANGKFLEYPGDFSYNTRAIFHRHEYLFMSVFEHEVQVFKPANSLMYKVAD